MNIFFPWSTEVNSLSTWQCLTLISQTQDIFVGSGEGLF